MTAYVVPPINAQAIGTSEVPYGIPESGSFTRASTGTYINALGATVVAAVNEPRWTHDPTTLVFKGLLIESAATNVVMNSATLVTQGVTVTAQAYTISFTGTGTVTLSGSFAGVLVGASSSARSMLTFTATAGTLTLTVTGSVVYAQLETGIAASSYIPTAGASVTRAADVCSASLISSVSETEHTEWAATTAYSLGAQVRRTTVGIHRIFERVVAGTTATVPELDFVNWLDAGATNRWGMFDMLTESGTANVASPLNFSLQLGTLSAVVLRGIDADSVTITMTSAGQQVYSYTQQLDGSVINGWDDYFFSEFKQADTVVRINLPGYSDGILHVQLTRESGTISLQKCIVGTAVALGETQFDARVRRTSFSKIDRNAYGNLKKLRRLKSVRRISQVVLARTDQLEGALAALDLANSCPSFFLGLERAGTFQNLLSLVAVVLDHDLSIANPIESPINIELEGV
jgi:hypothetical protein